MKTKIFIAATTCSRRMAERSRTAWTRLLPLLLLTLPTTLQAQDFTYTTNEGTITITGYAGPGGELVIPSTINGLPVTSIGQQAFRDCTSLTSVTIPDNVTSIGDGAFYGTGLTNIIIGNSVAYIGREAFSRCGNLTSIIIPDSVTNIGDYAFSSCTSLTNMTMGNSVTSLGRETFSSCTSLTSVTIPDSVTTIVGAAFYNCISLTNVTIGNSVTNIGRETFSSCTSLTSIVIPNRVATIGFGGFRGCSSLIGVYFQGNAPSVGAVFIYAYNVTVYYLPGTTGWGTTFSDRPTASWYLPYPVILSLPPAFGVLPNGFGFRISWATNTDVLVQACTDLTNPTWFPVGTNTLIDGWSYFSDPDCTNYPSRFYRVLGEPANPDPTRLVWIPPGTFTMGSPPTEPARDDDEGPQTQVTISRGFWMGKHEVTQAEYLDVMGTNPSYFRNGTAPPDGGSGGAVVNELRHPVEMVKWIDATDYCALLTERERGAGRLPPGYVYRLATEAEWEYACRAGTTTSHHYGDELRSGMENFHGEYEYPPCGESSVFCYNPSGIWLGRTAEVGSYAPNAWGLYDMHGNVAEWCHDWYRGSLPGGSVPDPTGHPTGSTRVLRGGSWRSDGDTCRSANRIANYPESAFYDLGFRVVLARPLPPFNPDPAPLVWIPPGTFTMGSPETEPARLSYEGPQTEVTISRGFWMGKHEVTQWEYLDVLGTNPSYFRIGTRPLPSVTGTNGAGGPVTNEWMHPVEQVSWLDATNYCALLTERERLAGRLPDGYVYRLPTEAEWEYACRAGTTTPFYYGEELRSGMANFVGDREYPPCGGSSTYCLNPSGIYLGRTIEVGGYLPNAWGLFDMAGNIHEWCMDWWADSLPGGSVADPTGPATGWNRVFRGGGSWQSFGYRCRSAYRFNQGPGLRFPSLGFRVVLAQPLPPTNPDPTRLVWIPPGTFIMGSPSNEVDRYDREGPQTEVTISRGFWLGKYEVTQGEYEAVMGNNPSRFTGDNNRPVERVSWFDATNYCAQLTQQERAAGRIATNSVYRLPTEAEWEYACRGLTSTRFSYGDDPGYTNLTNYAWYVDNSGGQTHPVGQKLPNAWGLYDMHGNLEEWCQDWFGEYAGGVAVDPGGPASGSYRVRRGGAWSYHAEYCRSAYRAGLQPESQASGLGFRVVLVAVP